MKILIVGEYSGFAANLNAGFKAIGHECIVVSYGDDWKKIGTDSNGYLLPRKNYQLGRMVLRGSWRVKGLLYFHKLMNIKKKYKGYFDVILLINYRFIRQNPEIWQLYFSFADLKEMLNREGKIYLSACGDDLPYLYSLPGLRYRYPSLKEKEKFYLGKRMVKIFEKTCQQVEGVIPVMYEYANAYRAIADRYKLKVLDTIPLPLSLKSLHPEKEEHNKIVIFHGVNRAAKGTALIVEALEKLKLKYKEKIEVVVDGRMPLAVYLNLLRRTDIIVDQCWGFSYGMNAIYGMALGKVVLSGNEPECGEEFQRKDVPIVNILPDTEDIVKKLEYFIEHPQEIERVGRQSRLFAESFHEAEVVAKRYLEVFSR